MQLKHEGMPWSERSSPENLLRTESCIFKVGFVVQKLHVPEMLKTKNFDELRSLSACSKFFGPAGAAR